MRAPDAPEGHGRRRWLTGGSAWALLLACGALAPRRALAAAPGEPAFEATSLEQTLAAIGPHRAAPAGLELEVPDVSEDGANVPVTISSALPGTRSIWIVVDRNPQPLVAQFMFPAGTEAFVSTRVKVAQSGRLYALVQAEGGVFAASRELVVQRGGCG